MNVTFKILLLILFLSIFGKGQRWDLDGESMYFNPNNTQNYFRLSADLTEKQALDELLNNSRYDNRSLPPIRADEPLKVTVSVLLLTLASPDESSLKYEVEFLLNLNWADTRVRYVIVNDTDNSVPRNDYPLILGAMPMRLNKNKREFLDALHHEKELWKPDIYYIKHGDFRNNLDPVHLALRIFPNGTIHFTTRKHLIISCKGDLPNFPFDNPRCSFCIESVSYEKDRLDFVWKQDSEVLYKSSNLSRINAYLDKNSTDICKHSQHSRGNYSCLQVKLTFERDRAFYFTTVFIPDMILVTSSFITFWLEWNAVPARIMLGVTTMLNFFTTSNSFRATLPVVSNLLAMNIWDGFSMFFIYASLLEFVFVNYIGRKRPKRPMTNVGEVVEPGQSNMIEANKSSPMGTPSLTVAGSGHHSKDIVSCTVCSANKSPCSHVNNACPSSPSTQNFKKAIEDNPIKIAKKIDVVSRIVFPIAYAIFVLVFFVKHILLQDEPTDDDT